MPKHSDKKSKQLMVRANSLRAQLGNRDALLRPQFPLWQEFQQLTEKLSKRQDLPPDQLENINNAYQNIAIQEALRISKYFLDKAELLNKAKLWTAIELPRLYSFCELAKDVANEKQLLFIAEALLPDLADLYQQLQTEIPRQILREIDALRHDAQAYQETIATEKRRALLMLEKSALDFQQLLERPDYFASYQSLYDWLIDLQQLENFQLGFIRQPKPLRVSIHTCLQDESEAILQQDDDKSSTSDTIDSITPTRGSSPMR